MSAKDAKKAKLTADLKAAEKAATAAEKEHKKAQAVEEKAYAKMDKARKKVGALKDKLNPPAPMETLVQIAPGGAGDPA